MIKVSKLILLVGLLTILAGCFGPKGQILQGVVLDAQTKEPIAGASIEVGGTELLTESDGSFSMATLEETLTLEISAPGYVSLSLPVQTGSRPTIELVKEAPVVTPVTTPPPAPNPGFKIGGAGVRYTPEDLNLLARLIHGEARGEPFEGQVAVGAVVLNRVKSSRYPNTIHGVVFQRVGRVVQFSVISDGQIWLTPNATAYRAAQAALDGQDPSRGSLGYFNPTKVARYDPHRRNWVWSRPVVRTIGNHRFFK